MRKILSLVTGLIFIFAKQVHSQRGDLSFGLLPIYKTNGYGIHLNAKHYHSVTDYFQLSVVAIFSRAQPDSTVEFPYEDYLMHLGYYTTVLTRPNRGLYIFFGGGPSKGYEYINQGKPDIQFEFQIPESGFVYGAFASFELDFFLTNSLSLIVPVEGVYHFNSKVDKSMLLLGAGIRLYLK